MLLAAIELSLRSLNDGRFPAATPPRQGAYGQVFVYEPESEAAKRDSREGSEFGAEAETECAGEVTNASVGHEIFI